MDYKTTIEKFESLPKDQQNVIEILIKYLNYTYLKKKRPCHFLRLLTPDKMVVVNFIIDQVVLKSIQLNDVMEFIGYPNIHLT